MDILWPSFICKKKIDLVLSSPKFILSFMFYVESIWALKTKFEKQKQHIVSTEKASRILC